MRKDEKEQFFNKLTIESGFIDPITVKRVYSGLLNLVRAELRQNKNCELPDLCRLHVENGALRVQSEYKLRFYARNITDKTSKAIFN